MIKVMGTGLTGQNYILLGKVQGFLEAFALFNSKTNHGCFFEFDVTNKLQSVEQTIHEYYGGFVGIEPNTLKLTTVADVKEELQSLLSRWLFNFLPENDLNYYLVDARQSFALSDEERRKQSVKELVELIFQVSQPLSIYKVEFNPVKWYDAYWEDFALENQDHIFILHLGLSD